MIVDKNTKLYFSISSNPGNFGSLLYNNAFRKLNMNAIYVPLFSEKGTDNFINKVESLRAIGAAGLSVSMPFKRDAFWHCITKTEKAMNSQSVNSIQIYTGGFHGHNTDYDGFLNSCKEKLSNLGYVKAVIFGTGCVAKTIYAALKEHALKVELVPRNDYWYLDNQQKEYNVLINATPVGMDNYDDFIFSKKNVKQYDFVFDVVAKKETNLISIAKKLGIPHANGISMALEQLCEQFSFYFNMDPPRDLFEKIMKENHYL